MRVTVPVGRVRRKAPFSIVPVPGNPETSLIYGKNQRSVYC